MTAEELDKMVKTLRHFVFLEDELYLERQINYLSMSLEAIGRNELARELDNLVSEIDMIPTDDIIRQGTFK